MGRAWKILGVTFLASVFMLTTLAAYRLTESGKVLDIVRELGDKTKETLQGGFVSAVLGGESTSTEQIRKHLEDRDAQFDFTLTLSGNSADFEKEAGKIFDSIFASDLYIKYMVKGLTYSYYGNGYFGKVTVKAEYWESKEESAFVQKEVQGILGSILTPGMNDHEKVKAIHDYVVLNTRYDTSLQEHSAYAALAKKEAVCQGYAMLVYTMLQEAGIPVKIVEGQAGQDDRTSWEEHGWNLVQLDGHWFHLDATWDDPTPDQAGKVDYNYYNLTDDELSANHQWEKKNYPPTDMSYYDLLKKQKAADSSRGAVYDSLMRKLELQVLDSANRAANRTDLERIFRRSLGQRSGNLTFLYSGSGQLESNVNDTLQAIGGQYGLRRWQYSSGPYLRTPQGNDEIVSIQFSYR